MQIIDRAKHLAGIAAPLAATQVSDMLTVAADTVMVGALGTTELAAVSLSTSSATLVLLFGLGFNVAITPLVAAHWGRADHQGARSVVAAGTRVSAIMAVLLVSTLLILSPWLHALGAPSDVTYLAIPYFQWYVGSFLFRLLFGIFKQTSEAMGNTKLPMLIAVVSNLLNILLNWMLIWGIAGLPALGVEGAGLATFLSRCAATVLAFLAWRRFESYRLLRTAGISADIVRSSVKRIWRSGAAIGAQITMEVMAFGLGAIMIGWIGATQLAAHQIALNLASITFMVALALGSASTITVAQAFGRGIGREVRGEIITALLLVVAFEAITAPLFIVLRSQLPTLYVDDPATIRLASALLLYAAAFQLFDGIQVVGLGILRGLDDTKVPTVIAFFAYTVIALPLGYVLSTRTSLQEQGVWIGYVVSLTIASLGFLIRIHNKTKKGQV
ncbi:MAG: MATE family efflux transporter [Ignavibacteria bacterium]|nr:MATE family efflux transporter [Ignavibacteria bacterium]